MLSLSIGETQMRHSFNTFLALCMGFLWMSTANAAWMCHCQDQLEEIYRCISSPTDCNCPRNSFRGVSTSNCQPGDKPDIWHEDNQLKGAVVIPDIEGLAPGQVNPPCGDGRGTSICRRTCITAPQGMKISTTSFYVKSTDNFGCRDYRNYTSCPADGAECGAGWSAISDISSSETEICATFKNWSDRESRCGKIEATIEK